MAANTTCQDIEQRWTATLLENDFKDADGNAGVFHLTDLGKQGCRFGSAKWDIPKRVSFIKQLATAVNRDHAHIFHSID